MEYQNSRWYKMLYMIINIAEKIIYIIIGILLPVQIGWINNGKPFSSQLSDVDLIMISNLTNFPIAKTIYYLDNIVIAISALIFIAIIKFTMWNELRNTNFKVLKKIAICITLAIIASKMINNA